MNEYYSENTDYSEMNMTQQLMARSIMESGSTPAPADKSDNEAVNPVPDTTADNSFSADNNVSEKAAPVKKSKGGRKKKAVVNDRDMLSKRLTELLSAAEKNAAEGKKINDEIDTIRKRLHEIELADLDGICTSKGISTQEIIEFMRGISDISELKNRVENKGAATL